MHRFDACRPTRAATVALAALLAVGPGGAGKAVAAGGIIVTCKDSQGRTRTSDRLMVECNDREQFIRNADGSIREVVPPTKTSVEREVDDDCKREQEAENVRRREAMLRDRNLRSRFPNEAVHAKARSAALDDVQKAIVQSNKRLAALAVERKPLADEAEFYVGRPMPMKLKQALDANDAATEAQRALIANQQAETVRINTLFDAELGRLKRLWAGSAPGTLDPMPPSTPSCSRNSVK